MKTETDKDKLLIFRILWLAYIMLPVAAMIAVPHFIKTTWICVLAAIAVWAVMILLMDAVAKQILKKIR